ncbi:site-specific integrase, partial [Frisingicoccus sp.]|uniref:site-specific integrase n=1 Tax=Frisingicoccus sp. TaxID=1918627 RepID=UPI002A7ED5C8
SSTIDVFAPEFILKTTLPAKKKPELYTPSDDDIKKLLQHIAGTELEIAVLLAAFGPMRRGEICALTSDDIHGNIVEVNKSMVLGPDGQWSVKQPKTYGSYRSIQYPDFVIKRMKGIEGRIIKATPNQISNRFKRAVIYSRLPHFRFHDLRHYAASIMHAIGVPDQYILQRGGWSSDNVMKTVYRNVIDLESTKQNKKILKHFEKMQHEMQHEG